MPNTVRAKKDGLVTTVIINQPEVKNACKVEAVHKLHSAFQTFDTEPDAKIAMLTGPNDSFCAGDESWRTREWGAIDFFLDRH